MSSGTQNSRGLICLFIARCAKRAVAIQLDCFVAPRSGTPRNDELISTDPARHLWQLCDNSPPRFWENRASS
jgi:hypothetical protein